MANPLPAFVARLCYTANAWLVGGAARQENPKDYDVVVPFSHWKIAASMLPPNCTPNTFGGWKADVDGVLIDIWPAELGDLMTNAMVTDLWHPQSGARFKKA